LKVLEYTRPRLYEAQEAAIFAPTRFAAVEASTKAGKSVGCLAWVVEEALSGPGDGATYPWIAPAYSLSQNMYRRTKRMLGEEAVAGTNESDLALTLVNGAQLWFRSGDRPDLLFGFDSHGAVIDEASRVSVECWHAVRSTLSATGGRARLIGNVSLRRDWFWKLCREIEAGERPDWSYARLTWRDAVTAGVITEEDIEEAKRSLPGPVFEALYEARQPSEGMSLFNTARLVFISEPEPDPTARWVRAWDMAASATSRSDYTVGSLMGRGLSEEVTVSDIVRGRWEPEEVLNQIVATAISDGPSVDVILEEEKGSSGRLLAEAVRRRLENAGAGMVHSAKISGDKVTRAYGLAGCVNAGNLTLLEAGWNADAEREMDAFPGPEHDDIIDSLSLGYNWLDQNPQVLGSFYVPGQDGAQLGGRYRW
jgi:predicted phage terminase large subunit-like protein